MSRKPVSARSTIPHTTKYPVPTATEIADYNHRRAFTADMMADYCTGPRYGQQLADVRKAMARTDESIRTL